MKWTMMVSVCAAAFAVTAHEARACGDMMMEMVEENGAPTVDVVGSKIRSEGSGEALTAEQVAATYRFDTGAQTCYDELLTRKPGLGGMVLSTVDIDGEGKVKTFKVHNRVEKDKTFENCLATAFQKLAFPKPKNLQAGGVVKASTVLRMNVGTQSTANFEGSEADLKNAIVGQPKAKSKG